jgi:hypothetical protein
MTKEITKARIIQEITDKFALRDLEPETFAFSEMVLPVYDIEQHLGEWETTFVSLSVTAIGGVQYYSVPYDEEWLLDAYNIVFMGAGAITVSGLFIERKNDPNKYIYLDLTAAHTVSYCVVLPHPFLLQPGDTINVNIDGYTSTQDLRLYINHRKEKLR